MDLSSHCFPPTALSTSIKVLYINALTIFFHLEHGVLKIRYSNSGQHLIYDGKKVSQVSFWGNADGEATKFVRCNCWQLKCNVNLNGCFMHQNKEPAKVKWIASMKRCTNHDFTVPTEVTSCIIWATVCVILGKYHVHGKTRLLHVLWDSKSRCFYLQR